MNSAARHSAKHPRARSATLAYLTARDETLARLRDEIERERAPKTPKQMLSLIVGKLNALIGRAG